MKNGKSTAGAGVENEVLPCEIQELNLECPRMAAGQNPVTNIDIVWKLYESHVGLFKHFLDMVLKFNVFYYAVTGAIFSFYFSRTQSFSAVPDKPLVFALIFVVLISACFAVVFWFAASRVQYMHTAAEKYQAILERFADPSNQTFNPTPEMKVLSFSCAASALLLSVITVLTLVYVLWLLCRA